MAHTLKFETNAGTTGLTMKLSFFQSGALHASLKNLACSEIGASGQYYRDEAAVPDDFRADFVFHTGTLTVAGDLTVAANYGGGALNPEESEYTKNIKTKTDFQPSITAGDAGGLLIAGSNAPTTFTTLDTGNLTITGNFLVSGVEPWPSEQSIAAAMFTEDTGETYGSAIAGSVVKEIADNAAGGGGSSGAFTVTATVTDGTDPLQGALVRITTLDGLTTGIGDATDASGETDISGDAATYDVVVTKDGFETLRTTRTITANNAGTLATSDLEMTAFALPAATDPDMCRLSGAFINGDGTPAAGAEIEATLYASGSTATSSGMGVVLGPITITLNDDGKVPSVALGDAANTELVRTDEFVRTGCLWSFTNADLRLNASGIELTATGFDLTTLLN